MRCKNINTPKIERSFKIAVKFRVIQFLHLSKILNAEATVAVRLTSIPKISILCFFFNIIKIRISLFNYSKNTQKRMSIVNVVTRWSYFIHGNNEQSLSAKVFAETRLNCSSLEHDDIVAINICVQILTWSISTLLTALSSFWYCGTFFNTCFKSRRSVCRVKNELSHRFLTFHTIWYNNISLQVVKYLLASFS